MADVLRRAIDLLVGDVVAHEGRPRTVEAMTAQGLFVYDSDHCRITFEDAPLAKRFGADGLETGETFKRAIVFPRERKFLLLESHYVAKGVTSGE